MSELPVQILQTTFLGAAGLFAVASVTRVLIGTAARSDEAAVEPPAVDSHESRHVELPASVLVESAATNPYEMPATIPSELPALPTLPATPGISTRHFRSLDLIWLGFIFLVFAGLAIAGAKMPATDEKQLNAMSLVTSIAFQFMLAGGTIGMMVWRVRLANWLGLKWKQWVWALLIAPLTVGTMWVLLIGLQLAGYMKWIESLGGEGVQDAVKLLQNSSDPVVLTLMSVAAVIVAPVCEEIIFRGYFYAAAKKFAGPWVAAICSALVFSAAHGNLAALLPLFILALALVVIYEKTGSIWAPIAVHFCFNGATVLLQLISRMFHLPLDPGT